MKLIWQKSDAGWSACVGDITLGAHPERTTHFGMKAARGTKWRACVSHWDEPTRTISRYGRDTHMQLCDTAKDAMRLAELVYVEEQSRS